jgi:hypothetical protein
MSEDIFDKAKCLGWPSRFTVSDQKKAVLIDTPEATKPAWHILPADCDDDSCAKSGASLFAAYILKAYAGRNHGAPEE